jgi:hypothetical protein
MWIAKIFANKSPHTARHAYAEIRTGGGGPHERSRRATGGNWFRASV